MQNMKVLHLFDVYLPGTMNWAYHLMHATPHTTQWVAAPWMVQGPYLSDEFRYFIRPAQHILGKLPKNEWQFGVVSQNLRRLEMRWPLYATWLEQQIKNDPPDLLHAHFGPVGWRYLGLAKRLDLPLVTSFYGYDYESLRLKNPIWAARYERLFQDSQALVATGPFGEKLLLEQGAPKHKTHPLYLSIRCADFPFVIRTKRPRQLRLLQVATITEKKGHLDTLASFKMALSRCPNLHLTLLGETQKPELAAQIHAYIKSENLSQYVEWLDFVPNIELQKHFANADVFGDTEGLPVSILEAASTGLPVIATRHADIPAEVLHEQTGLLVAERDVPALAAHIERFYWMENKEYQIFSSKAAAHIRENFEVKKAGKLLSQIYQSLLKSEI
jgi:colanic acid/amylovoran biosynthesis glycosyltransferase